MILRLLSFLLFTVSLPAALTVDPGLVRITTGTPSVQIPVMVTGGDLVTDMAAAVEAGNPPAGGIQITAVSYTGSIWQGAAGGFASFFTVPPPAAAVGPNVSLNTAGQRVAGNGVLMTLTLNTASLTPGDYPIKLSGTSIGGTVLVNGFNAVPATFVNGILRVSDDPLAQWRLTNFPGQAPNPASEATVWGNGADPDRDGLSNLVEFYLGTDPNVPRLSPATASVPGTPFLSIVTVSGQQYPAITFTRRINTGSSVTGAAEWSSAMQTWSSAGFVDFGSVLTLPGGEFQLVTRRYTGAQSSTPRVFLRCNVTAAAP